MYACVFGVATNACIARTPLVATLFSFFSFLFNGICDETGWRERLAASIKCMRAIFMNEAMMCEDNARENEKNSLHSRVLYGSCLRCATRSFSIFNDQIFKAVLDGGSKSPVNYLSQQRVC